MEKPYFNSIRKFIFLLDIAFLNLSVVIGHFLIFGNSSANLSSKAFIIIANVCWFVISLVNRNYKIQLPLNTNAVIEKFLMTLIYQSLLVLASIYFFKILNISRGFVIISFFVFALMAILQRTQLFYFIEGNFSEYLKNKVIILGNKAIADSLISAFTTRPEFGYNDYEYVETDLQLGFNETLKELLIKSPDEIFVCYKEMTIESLDKFILFGEQHSIKIKVVYKFISSAERLKANLDKFPILHLNTQPAINHKIKILKRVFDILFSTVLMIIGSPIFLFLYCTTKATSKGSAFYKQERIGKDEKPFYIYKFRSMYTNSEKSGPQLSKDNDPRITKWGKFMRKTRLDELPQFWNVLKGDMSIVGYRPERKHFIEEITKKTPQYKRLLCHKPGITSLGQVHYGYAENVDQMCERLHFDLLYFCNINLNSDVNIILKTVKVMVQGTGK
jgi:exopolysaccharide biosynthesis polyprenyl glycosylphosphotransferase